MTRETVLQIKKLKNDGKTIVQIAEAIGKSPTTVARWTKRLREAGHEVKANKRGRRSIIDLTNLE